MSHQKREPGEQASVQQFDEMLCEGRFFGVSLRFGEHSLLTALIDAQ